MGFLNDLIVRIRGDKSQLDNTLTSAKSSVSSFGSTVQKLGAAIGIAFSVRAIVNFTKEAMNLAAAAEGVRNAFSKIGSPDLLAGLKKATRGVLDESDIMALSVKAKNFNIPLQDLSTYLEFATNRAVTTGKSVADLTELIVTGLGRKSSRSFIQLGLSAKDVQEAFKSTAGIMPLITSALDKMGVVSDTAATRMGRLAANQHNLKESFGELVNNIPFIQKSISDLSQTFDNMSVKMQMKGDKKLSFFEKYFWTAEQYTAFLAQEAAIQKRLSSFKSDKRSTLVKDMTEEDWAQFLPKEKIDKTLAELRIELKAGEDAIEGFKVSEVKLRDEQQKVNASLREQIDLLSKLPATAKEAEEALVKLKEKNKPVWAETGHLKVGDIKKTPGKLSKYSGTSDQSVANAMAEAWGKSADESAAIAKVDDFKERLGFVLQDMKMMVVDYGIDILSSLGEALGGGDIGDLGKGLLAGLANLLSQFGKMLITLALGEAAFMQSLANPILWPVALAAGTAMVMAGGAIKGMLSSSSSGNNTSSGGTSSASIQQQYVKVQVEGTIRGKDIYIAEKRYIEDNG